MHPIPLSPAQLHRSGFDRPDVLILSGDAYCDHPSFGTALVARLLESFHLTVAIAAQPEWKNPSDLEAWGRPRLFVGVTAGNMDSMVNHYTAHKKKRRTDAYSPGGRAGLRPDRASIVYSQLARQVFPDSLIILGGVEASMRRFTHYDYWQDAIRRSVLLDARADLLVYGMAERPLRAIVDRLVPRGSNQSTPFGTEKRPTIPDMPRRDAPKLMGIRGTAFVLGTRTLAERNLALDHGDMVSRDVFCAPVGTVANAEPNNNVIPSHEIDAPPSGLFRDEPETAPWKVRRLPAFEAITKDHRLLAMASHIIERSSNPTVGEVLVQEHGRALLVVMPPARPLSSTELDFVHELPYERASHPSYRERIPAMEMIETSVQINRGCFGGCTFCAITMHQGRAIQSRSAASVLREVQTLVDMGHKVVSDLGGPTANTWNMVGRDQSICNRCRRPSCLHPTICPNLDTDHEPLRDLLRQVRRVPGLKRAIVASGVRHDLALRSPDYLSDLVEHHVGGHLHVAPEHDNPQVLALIRKPSYDRFEAFRSLFDRLKRKLHKQCYLNPYFMSGLPGSTDVRMAALVRRLRTEGWKPQQVQSFIPTPGTPATAIFASGVDPDDVSQPIEMPRTLGDKIRQHRILIEDLSGQPHHFQANRSPSDGAHPKTHRLTSTKMKRTTAHRPHGRPTTKRVRPHRKRRRR